MRSRTTYCPRCRKGVVVGDAAPPEIAPAPAADGSSSMSARGAATATNPHRSEGSESEGSESDDEPLALRAERKRKREEEEASAEALRHVRRCPGCGDGLEKAPRTCNKFQCRCGTRFCWKCFKLADASGQPTCKCTGEDHVYWDNVNAQPDGRSRLQFLRRQHES